MMAAGRFFTVLEKKKKKKQRTRGLQHTAFLSCVIAIPKFRVWTNAAKRHREKTEMQGNAKGPCQPHPASFGGFWLNRFPRCKDDGPGPAPSAGAAQQAPQQPYRMKRPDLAAVSSAST